MKQGGMVLIPKRKKKMVTSKIRAQEQNKREVGNNKKRWLHLTFRVTFCHMETLKLYRLCVVDHCGQIRVDISGSTYVFIRCHPSLLVFHSNQTLGAQSRGRLGWRFQQDSQIQAANVLTKDSLLMHWYKGQRHFRASIVLKGNLNLMSMIAPNNAQANNGTRTFSVYLSC